MANGERHHVDIVVSIDNVTYYVDVSIFNCGSSSNARLNGRRLIDILYYLDDGYLHGLVEETVKAFEYLRIEMGNVNQIFDMSKCTIFGNKDTLSLVDNFSLQKSLDGLLILGCPYGTPIFIKNSLSSSLFKLEIQCGYLKSISNPLSSYNILKYCINSKGTYLARVCTS